MNANLALAVAPEVFRWNAADLVSLFDDAGVDLEVFGKRFSDLGYETDADASLRKLRRYLSSEAPDHPLGYLQIVTLSGAIRLAGLDPMINGRPRSLTDENYAGTPDPQRAKWLAWLTSANAVHLRNPIDSDLLIEDLETALEIGASILVLDRTAP